jgi:hypothetical protein
MSIAPVVAFRIDGYEKFSPNITVPFLLCDAAPEHPWGAVVEMKNARPARGRTGIL